MAVSTLPPISRFPQGGSHPPVVGEVRLQPPETSKA
jgi:hypothetical protein